MKEKPQREDRESLNELLKQYRQLLQGRQHPYLEEDDFVTAHRLVYAEPKKYSRKISTFYLKYKNFMYSPKSHFVYKNVSI